MPTTLTLTQDIFIGGVRQTAGSSITVDDSFAGALISENKATRPADYGRDFKQDAQVVTDPVTNQITGIINPKTGALIPLAGGSGASLQTLTQAQATSPGITIQTGANIVRISPAITANVDFVIVGGSFGDSLSLLVSQDATGGRNLTLDGIDFGAGIALTKITINLTHDGTDWILTNNPIWS